jgi:hypothetical protein
VITVRRPLKPIYCDCGQVLTKTNLIQISEQDPRPYGVQEFHCRNCKKYSYRRFTVPTT